MRAGLPSWIGCLFLAGVLHSWAASTAVIVTGLSGSSENAEEFPRLAAETRELLVKRGLSPDRVLVMKDKVTRDAVLARLKDVASTLQPSDDLWLVLFGHSGLSRGDVPAFQVSGPRLTATDLKTALDAIPARQFVFIGTNTSGGFLPILKGSRRAVLAATRAEGEDDQPRFPGAWVQAFAEKADAPFAAIAARAAALVNDEYQRTNLAQSEHARLVEAGAEEVREAPFSPEPSAAPSAPPDERANVATAPTILPSASELTVPVKNPQAEWEHQPATAETRKIIAEAKAVPNPGEYAALVLDQRLGFAVDEDRTTDRLTSYRVYLAREEAVEEWANFFLPQSPPGITTKLEMARVIQADGSATVYNPANLPGATDPTSGTCSAAVMVYLPGTRAGCVVEIAFRTRQLLDATLPHVSEMFPVQRMCPVLKTSLEVRVPEKPVHRVVLKNVPEGPEVSSEKGRRIYRWQLGALPAAEALPGDPPAALWQAAVQISSLPSWDEFVAWFRRIAEGSDRADPAVAKTAAELAAGAPTRSDAIRREFEFVSALRYVAIEMGVQGFRPRTPAEVLTNRFGDCKDKANLLVALLRSQGIDARFVLLNRGGATDVDFPSWQFNHAICFVPRDPAHGLAEDLWLDATDSVTPFGFVPPGDHGRAGLVFGAKSGAEFKTVTGGTGAVSDIRDEWKLAQDAGGGWSGTIERRATGIADDFLRRAFRQLTPAQRGAQTYQILASLWPAAELTGGRVSDVSALSEGITLRAVVAAPAGDLPHLDAPGLEVFSAPERDRPLWLNEAQPLVLAQSVELRYAGAAPKALPEAFSREVAGQKLSVAWTRVDDRTVRRETRLDLSRPIVPAADYAPLRQAIRGWTAAQRVSLTNL